MITVTKNDLSQAVKAVKSFCGRATLQPILYSIHFKNVNGGLQLTTTDCVTAARVVIDANVDTPVDFCVNSDKIDNIISCLDNVITMNIEENKMITIKSGKTRFEVLSTSGDEFPHPDFDDNEGIKILLDCDDLRRGVGKTAFATAPETQSLLSGISFDFNATECEMAATDGNRLSVVTVENPTGATGKYIIASNFLSTIARNLDDTVDMTFKNNKVIVKSGNAIYSTVMLNGVYPAYKQLVPKHNPLTAEVKKNDILKALEKVSIMCDNKTNLTKLHFKAGILELKTNCDEGLAEDLIPVEFNDELEIAFNYRFLLDGIKNMDVDTITIKMNEPLSATLFIGDYTYLCMPVQLRK